MIEPEKFGLGARLPRVKCLQNLTDMFKKQFGLLDIMKHEIGHILMYYLIEFISIKAPKE